ncbi:MAG: hypothetical protein VYC39_00185 [Myxococcota bacterium]|nr:hypothetical protein [Myxococcota bacterium]
MAKAKKKNKNRKAQASQSRSSEANPGLSMAEIEALEKAEASLENGLKPFRSGDFISARAQFRVASDDEKHSADVKQRAKELEAATNPEPTAFKTGLACAGFLLLIMLVTNLFQP